MKIKLTKKDFTCIIDDIHTIKINDFEIYYCIFDYLLDPKYEKYHEFYIESDSFTKVKHKLIIKPEKTTSKIISSNEYRDIIEYKFLIKFIFNGKKRRKTIIYKHHKESSIVRIYNQALVDINTELSLNSLSKFKLKNITDLKNLEKLIFNEKIKKSISRTKRKEKLNKLIK